MRYRPRPSRLSCSGKGWGWIIVVGVVLLPLSPILSLIGSFVTAFLLDRSALLSTFFQDIYYSLTKEKRKSVEKEILNGHIEIVKKALNESEEIIYVCPQCGAVYTIDFLRRATNRTLPSTLDWNAYECFYCKSDVIKVDNTQGYFETMASKDGIPVVGEFYVGNRVFYFTKELRYKRYLDKDLFKNQDPILHEKYLDTLNEQLLILFSHCIEPMFENVYNSIPNDLKKGIHMVLLHKELSKSMVLDLVSKYKLYNFL